MWTKYFLVILPLIQTGEYAIKLHEKSYINHLLTETSEIVRYFLWTKYFLVILPLIQTGESAIKLQNLFVTTMLALP
jgi:hypothetical protein